MIGVRTTSGGCVFDVPSDPSIGEAVRMGPVAAFDERGMFGGAGWVFLSHFPTGSRISGS